MVQEVKTLDQLRDWLIGHKIPAPVASNGYALDAWEQALTKRTKGAIYAYWCMSGMNLHHQNVEIIWGDIKDE